MILFLTQYYSGLGHSMRIKHIAEETAKLTGDIVANKLSIEPGASFTGSCSMGAVIKDIKDLGAKQTEKEKTA